MKRRRISVLLAAMMLIMIFSGCGSEQIQNDEEPVYREFTDDVGRTVSIPENITRVAVTGPLAQIVVFSISPDKLVAIASEWSDDAEQYLDEKYYDMPVLGQIYGGTSEMNVEELAKVNPQIIIDVGETKSNVRDELESIEQQTGITAVHISAEFYTMDETYRRLGELLGAEKEANVLADYCSSKLNRTLDIMEKVGDSKVTAMYCLGDLGCNVICRDSYHSVVLDLLTDNAAISDTPSSKGTGNEVDMEQICIWNPDVIFFAPNSIYEIVEDEPVWAELEAIQSGNYYEVPYGIYNWMGFPPSVQRYLGMVWMTKVLYPQYADYDMYEEVSEFYNLFFHCEISKSQYEALTENSIGKLGG